MDEAVRPLDGGSRTRVAVCVVDEPQASIIAPSIIPSTPGEEGQSDTFVWLASLRY